MLSIYIIKQCSNIPPIKYQYINISAFQHFSIRLPRNIWKQAWKESLLGRMIVWTGLGFVELRHLEIWRFEGGEKKGKGGGGIISYKVDITKQIINGDSATHLPTSLRFLRPFFPFLIYSIIKDISYHSKSIKRSYSSILQHPLHPINQLPHNIQTTQTTPSTKGTNPSKTSHFLSPPPSNLINKNQP